VGFGEGAGMWKRSPYTRQVSGGFRSRLSSRRKTRCAVSTREVSLVSLLGLHGVDPGVEERPEVGDLRAALGRGVGVRHGRAADAAEAEVAAVALSP
jgi:hypothetical protein